MNIKNEHVHALAREAARRTGLTQTSVLERALEDYLARLDGADDARDHELAKRRARTAQILAEMDRLLTDDDRTRARRVMDELHDDVGLPR